MFEQNQRHPVITHKNITRQPELLVQHGNPDDPDSGWPIPQLVSWHPSPAGGQHWGGKPEEPDQHDAGTGGQVLGE